MEYNLDKSFQTNWVQKTNDRITVMHNLTLTVFDRRPNSHGWKGPRNDDNRPPKIKISNIQIKQVSNVVAPYISYCWSLHWHSFFRLCIRLVFESAESALALSTHSDILKFLYLYLSLWPSDFVDFLCSSSNFTQCFLLSMLIIVLVMINL